MTTLGDWPCRQDTGPSLGEEGRRHLDWQPPAQAAHVGQIPCEATGGLLPEMGVVRGQPTQQMSAWPLHQDCAIKTKQPRAGFL